MQQREQERQRAKIKSKITPKSLPREGKCRGTQRKLTLPVVPKKILGREDNKI